jgi:uncharacterized protein
MDVYAAIDHGDLAAALDAATTPPRGDRPGPILYALYQGKRDIAAALADRAGRLDLAEASALDRPDRVADLLDAGAPVDGRTPDGYTPLQLAAFFGRDAAAEVLIARGADVDAVADNDMRIRPLHAAVAGRHRQIARRLLAAGAQVDAAQQHGWTPLLAAADNGDAELVAALLAAGADPSLGNDAGLTPAAAAAAKGHTRLADDLATAA